MSLRPISRTLLRTILAARPSPRIIRPHPRIALPPQIHRWNSSTTPATSSSTPATPERDPQPSYQLTFTCRPCQTRSTHAVTKQAYHGGTVLIQCPGCKNRHVIADHLKIFGDTRRTLEDILKENGEVLKRARLLENGDMELMPEEGGELPPAEGVEEGKRE